MGKSRSARTTAAIRVGTSGWIYPHWRGRFYPEAMPQSCWFAHYAAHFNTVEINNTFYRLPEATTFEHWREQAPEGFEYAVKANRYLTHQKKLREAGESLERFLEAVRLLGNHLGPILFQLPPRWNFDAARLRSFLALLPDGTLPVFEFRDRSWLCRECFALLEHHGACLCIHDLLPRHPRVLTGPAAYVRFHGAGEVYGGSYRRTRLRRWAEWLKGVREQGLAAYAFFNNDENAYAVYNAKTLLALLA
jgi:uncharacterized protein YecE (DUF72 family)